MLRSRPSFPLNKLVSQIPPLPQFLKCLTGSRSPLAIGPVFELGLVARGHDVVEDVEHPLFPVPFLEPARLLRGIARTTVFVGKVVHALLKPSNANGFSTYGVNLTNISSLTFANRPEDYAPAFALDNIVIDDGVGGVPEPATWGLLIFGFAGIGSAMRKANRRATNIAAVKRSRVQ